METIALIEWLDADGQVRQVHRVHQWPQRIGRALDNDLVIDDPHVAAHHAELHGGGDDQAVHLQVGQTINGVVVMSTGQANRLLQTGQRMPASSGQQWQLGGVTLRLRLPGETLAPELPMPVHHAHSPWLLPALALLWLGMLAGTQWVETDPGTPWLEAFIPVLAGPLALVLWCAAWALLSKLFRGRFAFGVHLRIALPWLAGLVVLLPLLHQIAFAFSWPAASRVGAWIEMAGSCAMVWQHLTWVLPKRRLQIGALTAVLFSVVSLYIGYTHNKKQQRWFDQLYSSTISLPGLRMAPTVPVEQFVQRLESLEAELTQTAADPDDETAPDEAAEDSQP